MIGPSTNSSNNTINYDSERNDKKINRSLTRDIVFVLKSGIDITENTAQPTDSTF